MASYYYLIASLPTLQSGAEMPLGYGDFLSMCKGNVDRKTYSLLEELTPESGGNSFMKGWAAFYGAFKEELNFQRNSRLGRNQSAPQYRDYQITNLVSAALQAPNPLEAERMMLDFEFKKLDSLVGLHYFDEYVLFGYAVKLKLLERVNLFEKEKGKKEFGRLMEQVRSRVFSL